MNISTLLRTSALGLAVLAAPAAWAADMTSQDFLTKAIQGNLAEVSVGQLAEKMGATDPVKHVGQTLVTDHTKANEDALSVAKQMNVTAPTAPTDAQKAMHDKLAAETGTTFDHDFLDGMIQDHKADIADYEKEAAASDAVGQYAARTLPTLKQHLAELEKVAGTQNNTGAMAATGPGPMLEKGANSFTEGEAKAHIERAGYTGVSALKKDDQGIWRGTATKAGVSMPVGLDFKGNVSSR